MRRCMGNKGQRGGKWWGHWGEELDRWVLESTAPWTPSMLSHLGTSIREFFPQFYPSLKSHLLFSNPLWWIIISAEVLFPDDITHYLKSKMTSLIIYNPQTTRTLCPSTLPIWIESSHDLLHDLTCCSPLSDSSFEAQGHTDQATKH